MGKLILELECSEARDLLLRPNSYCNFGLPAYFNVQNLLDCADDIVQKGGYRNSGKKSGPGAFEGVNYTLLANKDGAYAWRPYELVHPILYIELVNLLTEEKNWNCIKKRFKEMQCNDKIIAVNIPQKPDESKGNTEKEENINRWWSEIEQASIKLSLEFKYLTTTDITDCYGSLYTHSVAWALHDKKIAKANHNELDKKDGLLGNSIDNFLQDMHNRQTNGIPQGNMVSDLIAEMVLGFADMLLSKQLKKEKIEDYKILRYRDDYRIFTNSCQDAEKILLKLSSILAELNFKLNPNKTVIADNVIDASVKTDKNSLILSNYRYDNLGLQHKLFYIRNFSKIHKNSGSVSRLFGDFRKCIENLKEKPDQNDAMVAIVVDIMLNNPRTYATGASVISKLMSFDTRKERDDMYRKIERKFTDVPNVGYLDICLQRISIKSDRSRKFDEPLCKLVSRNPIISMLYESPIVTGEMVDGIWNSAWLKPSAFCELSKANFIDDTIIDELDDVISLPETEIYIMDKYDK
ncbi:RNA-directed DNA polymerase [Candidatus Minimicrobia sp. QA0096]|uniref:RNA-directed DNA polymerase n=1 Tax=Candidatus Minimicrobia sp. QA0096 TaxID=3118470 RepID=UPI0030CCCE50